MEIQITVRCVFLIKTGHTKEVCIATVVVIALMIDFTCLTVNDKRFTTCNLLENIGLIFSPVISAILGALIGKKLLQKVTLQFIQVLVAVLLSVIAVALGAGII